MSAIATKMLVLGVVALFEPANGYQLRRELLSWDVDKWASINPGSIYSMLTGLTKQGLVERHDLQSGSRPVAVYTMTDRGRSELHGLVLDAISMPESGDQTDLRAALNFQSMAARADFLAAVEVRISKLHDGVAAMKARLEDMDTVGAVPPHVAYNFGLDFAVMGAEANWLEKLRDTIRSGGLAFKGETPSSWAPPEDDPGWRMARERDAYREQIAAQR